MRLARCRWPWLARAAGGAVGAAALLGAATAVTIAWHDPATRSLAQACCRYSPARLARGELWTLVGSALLLPRLRMIGPTTLMTTALFVPYALAAGALPALRAFFAGHVLTTVAVAAVVLPAAALGWSPAVVLRTRTDVGASAGLAAAAGAFCLLLGPRRAGPVLLAVVAAWFGMALARTHRLVEIEHLLALGTGGICEWTRRQSSRVHRLLTVPAPSSQTWNDGTDRTPNS